MTDTSDGGTAAVVHEYYEVLAGSPGSFDPERLSRILTPDLDFEGPIAGHRVGAEFFVKGASGFAETARSVTMLHQMWSGRSAAALYDAELPGGTVRFAEFFDVDGGRIQKLRLLYDATEYRAKGGR